MTPFQECYLVSLGDQLQEAEADAATDLVAEYFTWTPRWARFSRQLPAQHHVAPVVGERIGEGESPNHQFSTSEPSALPDYMPAYLGEPVASHCCLQLIDGGGNREHGVPYQRCTAGGQTGRQGWTARVWAQLNDFA